MQFLVAVLFHLGFLTAAGDSPVYGHQVKTIEGKVKSLSKYKGKTLLVVNIATRCGRTPQLEGLEAMYKKYKSKGLVVLGMPSNDFGGQTPETEKGVKEFCKLRYGVTFPLTQKAVVKGEKKHPLIRTLIGQSGGDEIAWNFEKFLVDKNGKVIQRFGSAEKPKAFESKVEQAL